MPTKTLAATTMFHGHDRSRSVRAFDPFFFDVIRRPASNMSGEELEVLHIGFCPVSVPLGSGGTSWNLSYPRCGAPLLERQAGVT